MTHLFTVSFFLFFLLAAAEHGEVTCDSSAGILVKTVCDVKYMSELCMKIEQHPTKKSPSLVLHVICRKVQHDTHYSVNSCFFKEGPRTISFFWLLLKFEFSANKLWKSILTWSGQSSINVGKLTAQTHYACHISH